MIVDEDILEYMMALDCYEQKKTDIEAIKSLIKKRIRPLIGSYPAYTGFECNYVAYTPFEFNKDKQFKFINLSTSVLIICFRDGNHTFLPPNSKEGFMQVLIIEPIKFGQIGTEKIIPINYFKQTDGGGRYLDESDVLVFIPSYLTQIPCHPARLPR